MRLIRTIAAMRARSAGWRRTERTIGFVPTMGALHEGHLSLIRRAAAETERAVVSVFVNPAQFGPHEDYQRYPRNLPRDVRMARAAGAAVVFAPTVRAMYPDGFQTSVDPGRLAVRWEGACRPGHFRGVATVVLKLLAIVNSTHTYLGQKDYQQALVIRQLVEDFTLPTVVRILPTVRDSDGVAISSRNAHLTPAQRHRACALFAALAQARDEIRRGARSAAVVRRRMEQRLHATPSLRTDYAAVVDATALEPVRRLHGRVALLVAARVGRTRLIDNLLVDV